MVTSATPRRFPLGSSPNAAVRETLSQPQLLLNASSRCLNSIVAKAGISHDSFQREENKGKEGKKDKESKQNETKQKNIQDKARKPSMFWCVCVYVWISKEGAFPVTSSWFFSSPYSGTIRFRDQMRKSQNKRHCVRSSTEAANQSFLSLPVCLSVFLSLLLTHFCAEHIEPRESSKSLLHP